MGRLRLYGRLSTRPTSFGKTPPEGVTGTDGRRKGTPASITAVTSHTTTNPARRSTRRPCRLVADVTVSLTVTIPRTR